VQVVLPAWLAMNGLARDHIKIVTMEPAVIDAALIEGKTDLAECWLASSWPPLRAQARAAGETIDWIEYRKYGLDIYGNGLTTTDRLINERPDLVRRFVKATYRGYEYLQKDPAGSAAAIVKLYPTLVRQIALEQIQEINELIIDPAVREKGLGWQTEERMQKTADFINRVYKIDKPIPAGDIYTDKFLRD
jgi:NitT/TauT family transport system substrate-binding protein